MSVFLNIFRWFSRRGVSQLKLLKAVALVLCLNIIFGLLFYWAEAGQQEGLTISDSIWWSMVTMTTVGYGDYYPQTFIGRYLVAYPCFLIGIGLLAYLVGVIAEAMIDHVSKKKKGLMQLDLSHHIIICHCPQVEKILQLVKELKLNACYKETRFVLISPKLEEIPNEFKGKDIKFVKGDPTKEEVLHQANVKESDGVIILAKDPLNDRSDIDTFAISAIVEMISKDVNREIKVVVEMVSKSNENLMHRAKTDGLVSSEGIGDCLLTQEYLSPGIHDVIQQLITNTEGSQFYIQETKLQNHKISDIQIAIIQDTANIQLVGLIRQGTPNLNPPKSTIIEQGDKLILLAETQEGFTSIENNILLKTNNT